MLKRALSLAALTLLLTGPATAAPKVVASIKPIHSLVSAVMAGLGEPGLIVKGAASPHTYSLRPSDAAALESADIVFWTGHGLELFLANALDTLAPRAEQVELAETPGLVLLPLREGGTFEPHSHGDEDHDHDHDHGESDMHFWLDPANARLMVSHIATVLAEADPENAAAYDANAEAELLRLDALEAELRHKLAPLAGKPFLVFHDAYQYFEARFGLELAGAVTISPDVMPGAARIDQLRDRLAELGATCVFAEPNFEPAIIRTIVEGTKASSGMLDPEGSALAEGPDLYPQLLRGLADGLLDCLVRASAPISAAP